MVLLGDGDLGDITVTSEEEVLPAVRGTSR
jgi:hypothetical protein